MDVDTESLRQADTIKGGNKIISFRMFHLGFGFERLQHASWKRHKQKITALKTMHLGTISKDTAEVRRLPSNFKLSIQY